jgi:hypothetical protein
MIALCAREAHGKRPRMLAVVRVQRAPLFCLRIRAFVDAHRVLEDPGTTHLRCLWIHLGSASAIMAADQQLVVTSHRSLGRAGSLPNEWLPLDYILLCFDRKST